MNPGTYPGLSMDEYLAIPAMSGGLLDTLLTRCPLAAWFESYLNPNRVRVSSDEMDIGTIAHAMLLEGGPGAVEIIDPNMYPTKSTGNIPDGWTNKEIKAARDNARAAGKIPILAPKFAPIEAMVRAAGEFIGPSEIGPWFGKADRELTIVWQEDGVLCKARFDAITRDRTHIVNYKTTSGSVEPDRWGRTQLLDYYVGGAFYVRGAIAAFGVDAAHTYLCQETTAPYLCSLVGLDPQWLGVGEAKVRIGLAQWRKCVAEGRFPGYPTRIAYPEFPQWEQARFEEKQIADGIDYGSQA